ncbi:Type I restriction-modification system, specificity subunit S [Pediococcus damnosus]|uniref:restriction endonuclease subunit S n=1 Tax=Pediococcus damnosus TaxID=51663 RepID=UPI00078CA62B|nr:restriction endonuclease subunit S [Pediococcus damnosus]AMV69803.1 Type I restriction-modification system, specificity subunit S [Pediococcus damnosus]
MSDQKQPNVRFAGFDDAWEQRKLNEVVNIIDGDRGKNYPHESDFYNHGDTLFLDTGNVRKNGFNFQTLKYITKYKDSQLQKGKLKIHDFVLTSRGTLGNLAYYDKDDHGQFPSVRINSAMLILRPILNNMVSNSFLESVFRGRIIDLFMKKDHVGSAQPHITKRDFSRVVINIPVNKNEQSSIGLLLKSVNDLIAANQSKSEQLKKLKKWFMQNMFI